VDVCKGKSKGKFLNPRIVINYDYILLVVSRFTLNSENVSFILAKIVGEVGSSMQLMQ
jgi:hypothetical protein